MAVESSTLTERLKRVAERVTTHIAELAAMAELAHTRLEERLRARYHAECGAVAALAEETGAYTLHFSAQPEPYLTRNTPFTTPNTPRHLLNTRKTTRKQSLNATPIPQKALALSRKVDECKPLRGGAPRRGPAAPAGARPGAGGRGLHSFTCQLNLSRVDTQNHPSHPKHPLTHP